jgi:DNA-binding IclR family transcriptional regulator
MSQQVPAVERALEILELLGGRPDELLGLSDVARALSLNKASCYATLTLLADRGYLIRHADKTYSLGPAILPLANSFLRDQDTLQHARPEMTALSRELNLDCIASAVIDNDMVILAKTASQESFGVTVRLGSRFPLVPPLGTVFLAWADSNRVRRWLAGLPPDVNAGARDRYLDALTVVRQRGYSVAIGGDRGAGRRTQPLNPDDYLLFELGPDHQLPVGHIAAPVFDPEGAVRLSLTVIGFHDQLASHDIPTIGERLLAATTAVAHATWGTVRKVHPDNKPAHHVIADPKHRPTRRRRPLPTDE